MRQLLWKKKFRRIAALVLLVCSLYGQAQVLSPENKTTQIIEINNADRFINFGAVYTAQWLIYVVDQNKVIADHGSFKNWYQYPFQPQFDKDNFDFNLIRHSIAGNYYYLFYRYRGYSIKESFIWSVVSSLAFEFTVETVTEKPSIQDIYQTPVLGTVVGLGVENLSQFLHSTDTIIGSVFGYILNPFTLLSDQSEVMAMPIYSPDHIGASLAWRF